MVVIRNHSIASQTFCNKMQVTAERARVNPDVAQLVQRITTHNQVIWPRCAPATVQNKALGCDQRSLRMPLFYLSANQRKCLQILKIVPSAPHPCVMPCSMPCTVHCKRQYRRFAVTARAAASQRLVLRAVICAWKGSTLHPLDNTLRGIHSACALFAQRSAFLEEVAQTKTAACSGGVRLAGTVAWPLCAFTTDSSFEAPAGHLQVLNGIYCRSGGKVCALLCRL